MDERSSYFMIDSGCKVITHIHNDECLKYLITCLVVTKIFL